MKKESILFVIPHLNGGGAEKVLIDILNNFNYEKYDVDLLVIFQEGVYINQIPKSVNVIYLINQIKAINKVPGKVKNLFYKFIKIFGMKKLYDIKIKKKYDIEIAFLEGIATKLIASSSNRESKKIAWVHIDLLNNHWTNQFYKYLHEEIEAYKQFDNIVCVSEDTKKAFINKFGYYEGIKVIYNPLDTDKIIKLGEEKVNFNNSEFTICSVGRLVPQKGFDRLINVAKMLENEGYIFKLNIIGCGGEKNKLLQLISKYNLENSVKLLGFDKNPYKYIKNSDLFVCSSRNEGFSLVVAEALILNKPIISTECAGPIEILKNGEYGIITKNSEEGLYKAIKNLYHDLDERKRLEEKSKERVKFFSIDDKMRQIYSLLK